MKSLLVLFPALLGQAEPPKASPRPPEPPGGIVAVVGDEVITEDELEKAAQRRRAEYLRRMPAAAIDREYQRLRRAELENLIDDKLILQKVRREEKKEGKPHVTDLDVDAYIKKQADDFKKRGEAINSPEDIYLRVQQTDGLSREEYRGIIKDRIAINNYIFQHVLRASDAFVSPQEMRNYYESHREEFVTPVRISFRQIILNPDRNDAVQLLLQLIEKGLESGQDFVELARTVEEHIGGAPESADFIWDKTFEELKDWHAPIPDVLKGMKKGETSGRVLTVKGDIRYFKVEHVVEGEPKPFEEAQEEIEKKMRNERNNRRWTAWLKGERKKVRIEVSLPPLKDPE